MTIKTEQRKIKIQGLDYPYTLRRRPYTRTLRLSLAQDGSLTVTVPSLYPIFLLKKFLISRFDWIAKNVEKIKSNPSIFGLRHTELQVRQYKKQTRILVKSRLEYFNQFYGFSYRRVAIRNQKSRWGSCSTDKNLNFNYRLCLLPPEIADYIIVHELCHTREMNHSPAFWQLVAKTIPDYKIRKANLRKI
ncbi:MAG: SprT family zinc-dependent metalloprotease [Patescibacteria group bacterium]|nr:SprT family zinc-dependent metalloprotease [Patescibacteria group bacterium]